MLKFKAARVAAVMTGGAALLTATPSLAQRSNQPQTSTEQQAPNPQQQLAQRRYDALSRAEKAAFAPLLQANAAANQAQAAGQTPNWEAVAALIPAAQAAARGNEARHILAQVQLEIALRSESIPAQEQALAALVASPIATPEEVASFRRGQAALLRNRARAAFDAGDFAAAERIFLQLQQANPGDQTIASDLAIVRRRMGNVEGAFEGEIRQIQAAEAGGQRLDELTYRRVRDSFYTARNLARALEFGILLARNYSTPANWRDAILIYRETANLTPALTIDLFRLSRAANSLQGEGDYLTFAQLLRQGGFPAEAKAVLEEGISKGAYPRTRQGVPEILSWAEREAGADRTGLTREVQAARAGGNAAAALAAGDALYGVGRYAEAAEIYRVTLGKAGADRNLVNLRLGASLAMAGQRAEAETALRAAGGQASGLAQLWLAWLSRAQG